MAPRLQSRPTHYLTIEESNLVRQWRRKHNTTWKEIASKIKTSESTLDNSMREQNGLRDDVYTALMELVKGAT